MNRAMIRHIRDEPAAFSPDVIRILSCALDAAWLSARADRSGFAIEGHETAVRELLARHIVDLAKKGERDRDRLVESALYRLRL